MGYWLMKSEPREFSVDDLAARPDQTEPWDGVRNYQARNMLQDGMKIGDLAFFYHSSCAVPGIAGIVRIVREAYPDPTAFDPQHKHFDAGSDPIRPRWFRVDVQLVRKTLRIITLNEMKNCPALEGLPLLRRGNRLSILPVTHAQWQFILSLEGRNPSEASGGNVRR